MEIFLISDSSIYHSVSSTFTVSSFREREMASSSIPFKGSFTHSSESLTSTSARDTDFRTLTAGEQQKLPFAEKKD